MTFARNSTRKIGQKRRSSTQHIVIVEGVIESSDKLLQALQDINHNQLDVDK